MTHAALLIALAALLMTVAPPAASAATPAGIYHEFCEHCHTPGIADAPRLGDTAEWARRIRTGQHLLLQSAIEGMPNTAMPPRGGHRQLSDAQLRDAVARQIQPFKRREKSLPGYFRGRRRNATRPEWLCHGRDFASDSA